MQFVENREDQIKDINRGLNVLMYQHGLDLETIMSKSPEELIGFLKKEIPPGWYDRRYIAALKSVARDLA